ncbi:hypothetical protein IWZ03DRAFT_362806 [Phyllosticta citriasiana]|uniref:Uncharacterized protein n=1 Tax=Phyllosticta citriasiana TaxID=595635 RepID=A0ABR1KB59_9PEZI
MSNAVIAGQTAGDLAVYKEFCILYVYFVVLKIEYVSDALDHFRLKPVLMADGHLEDALVTVCDKVPGVGKLILDELEAIKARAASEQDKVPTENNDSLSKSLKEDKLTSKQEKALNESMEWVLKMCKEEELATTQEKVATGKRSPTLQSLNESRLKRDPGSAEDHEQSKVSENEQQQIQSRSNGLQGICLQTQGSASNWNSWKYAS